MSYLLVGCLRARQKRNASVIWCLRDGMIEKKNYKKKQNKALDARRDGRRTDLGEYLVSKRLKKRKPRPRRILLDKMKRKKKSKRKTGVYEWPPPLTLARWCVRICGKKRDDFSDAGTATCSMFWNSRAAFRSSGRLVSSWAACVKSMSSSSGSYSLRIPESQKKTIYRRGQGWGRGWGRYRGRCGR